MSEANVTAVSEALSALGNAWRMDWSDFDGRTLRSQLDELAGALTSDTPFDVRRWYASLSICPDSRNWSEWCGPGRGCPHLEAIYEELRAAPAGDA